MSDRVPVAVMLAAMKAHATDERSYNFPASDETFSVKRYILRQANFEQFQPRSKAFQALPPPTIDAGWEMTDLELTLLGVQRRIDNRLFDDNRLLSVLVAIGGNTALPPISITDAAGQQRSIENGFHRYIASIVAGFSHIPALTKIREAPSKSSGAKWKPRRMQNLTPS